MPFLADVASPAPTVKVGPCGPVFRGIAGITNDPTTPLTVRSGQSFVIALRVPTVGYSWKLVPSTERVEKVGDTLVPYDDGEASFGTPTSVSINDASYRPAGSPLIVGSPLTQFFLFAVPMAPDETPIPVGSHRLLTFQLTGYGGKPDPLPPETFTVIVAPNAISC